MSVYAVENQQRSLCIGARHINKIAIKDLSPARERRTFCYGDEENRLHACM